MMSKHKGISPNKKYLTSRLKQFSVKKIGRKSLKYIRKFIKDFIPLNVKRNSPYNEMIYFYSLMYMALNKGTAERSSKVLNMDYGIPSPDSILRKFRFSENMLHAIRDNMLYGITRVARKQGAFKQKVDIAIDPFDKPYYGDINDLHVVGTKHKKGTNYAHSFVTLDSIVKGERFCLSFLPRTMKSKDTDIVENLIKTALERVSIRIALLDREFYQVEIVKLLFRYGLKFIIPAVNKDAIKKLKKKYRNELPCVLDYTMTSGSGEQISVKLALVKRDKEVHGFITNLDWEAEEIASYYNNRWGIETNHRERNEFLAWTTSQNYELRYLYYLISVMLHNIWIFINMIITRIVYGIISDPVMEKYMMKHFAMREIYAVL